MIVTKLRIVVIVAIRVVSKTVYEGEVWLREGEVQFNVLMVSLDEDNEEQSIFLNNVSFTKF